MGFFDISEFTEKIEDSKIIPHPLATKIKLDVKTSYFGMMIFAALVNDVKIEGETRKNIRRKGLAMQLSEQAINECIESVTGLKSQADKMEFVKESIPILDDRDTAMFLYCDMVAVMTLAAALSEDAKAFLASIAGLWKLNREDLNFLNEYSGFISAEDKTRAENVIHKYSRLNVIVPDGLVAYFTPTLPPTRLTGGNLPAGETRLCNGKFFLDTKLVVSKESKLVMDHAEITFGTNGWIEIEKDGDTEFRNSKFIATDDDTPQNQDSSLYMICGNGTKIPMNGCEFNGNMRRLAIWNKDGDIDLNHCTFESIANGSRNINEFRIDDNTLKFALTWCSMSCSTCELRFVDDVSMYHSTIGEGSRYSPEIKDSINFYYKNGTLKNIIFSKSCIYGKNVFLAHCTFRNCMEYNLIMSDIITCEHGTCQDCDTKYIFYSEKQLTIAKSVFNHCYGRRSFYYSYDVAQKANLYKNCLSGSKIADGEICRYENCGDAFHEGTGEGCDYETLKAEWEKKEDIKQETKK